MNLLKNILCVRFIYSAGKANVQHENVGQANVLAILIRDELIMSISFISAS
jgi:hypothetical protein